MSLRTPGMAMAAIAAWVLSSTSPSGFGMAAAIAIIVCDRSSARGSAISPRGLSGFGPAGSVVSSRQAKAGRKDAKPRAADNR